MNLKNIITKQRCEKKIIVFTLCIFSVIKFQILIPLIRSSPIVKMLRKLFNQNDCYSSITVLHSYKTKKLLKLCFECKVSATMRKKKKK